MYFSEIGLTKLKLYGKGVVTKINDNEEIQKFSNVNDRNNNIHV